MNLTKTTFSLLLLSSAAMAQETTTILADMPMTLGVATPVHGMSPTSIYHKEAGAQTGTPAEINQIPDYPHFGSSIMFPFTEAPVLGSMSLGRDWLNFAPNGNSATPPDNWTAITFSLTADSTVDGNAGGVLSQQMATPGGAHSDVFAYITDDSFALPAQQRDQTHLVVDNYDIRLQNLVANENTAEVDRMDATIAALFMDLPLPGLTGSQDFFFTVKNTGSLPPSTWNRSAASRASILSITWNPNSNSWSSPVVRWSYQELGLRIGDEITALAVDETRGLFMYSRLRRGAEDTAHDPFMIAWYSGDTVTSTEVARTSLGTRLSDKIKIRAGGTVDAVCSLDPGLDLVGNIVTPPITSTTPLNFSTAHVRDRGPGNFKVRMRVSGFVAPPNQDEVVDYYLFVPGGTDLLFWTTPLRNPGNRVVFHDVEAPIDPSIVGMEVIVYGHGHTVGGTWHEAYSDVLRVRLW